MPPLANVPPIGSTLLIGVSESPVPASCFVRQPVDAVLHEALHPLVDKASADPHRGRNVGDRHTIGQLQDDAPPSRAPCAQCGPPLSRAARLHSRSCAADGKCCFTATSHKKSLRKE